MRILILGAGATGGYFGGRLLETGCDVTFLVRARRAEQLAARGLEIRSELGDAHIREVSTILEPDGREFDVILLSCKAFDLHSAISAIQPFVSNETVIIPLLNGMMHMTALTERLGEDKVLGGFCAIAVTLDENGVVRHLNTNHILRFGEISGKISTRVSTIEKVLLAAPIEARASKSIVHDMWEKWIMLATLAGINCLIRGTVGDILNCPYGESLMLRLLDECSKISDRSGFTARPAFFERTLKMLTDSTSDLTASMLRDLQNGNRTEADHVIGDLILRGEQLSVDMPLLQAAYCNLKVYELHRFSPT